MMGEQPAADPESQAEIELEDRRRPCQAADPAVPCCERY
jgi:hypothetical protein